FAFMLLLQPPSVSPLFPYTTLFRSPVVLQFTQHTAVGQLFIGDFGRGRRCLPGLQRQQRGGEQRERRHQREQPSGRPPGWDGREDRKSTRLNSSHASIAYAVFCSKK